MHRLISRVPTIEEYTRLCRAVGWGDVMNFTAAEAALPRSLHAVVVEADGETIGMGRVVGDGAIFFYIQDVAVLPAWQGQGIGDEILTALVEWVDGHAPDKAFLGLFAIKETVPFYERFGFAAYDHDVGMYQVIRRGHAGRSDEAAA
jgi:GNAT superfamily N-acetyltransferase